MYIFHKNNKILTNSQQGLTSYLSTHKLFLQSTCDRCYTHIESQFLDFDLDKSVLAAVNISFERLMVSDKENSYQMNSYFLTNKSNLIVDRIDKARPLTPVNLELPLLPKYRIRNRQHFIDKMRTYLLFS